MPLSSNSQFGVVPLTQAINRLPVTPTIIRSLGIFAPKPLTTTYVRVENKNGALRLVKAVPRNAAAAPPARETRNIENFDMLHLPRADVVMADDVQNVREFGGEKTTTVAKVVNDKLASMKADIEMTREYLMLGALQGKIMNADGTSELLDIYNRFGFTRQAHVWDLGTQTTKVGEKIDETMTALKRNLNGEAVNGWICLCSPAFMRALVYHDKIVRIYERYEQAKVYREGETWVDFMHKNIKFIQYDHDFGNGIKNCRWRSHPAARKQPHHLCRIFCACQLQRNGEHDGAALLRQARGDEIRQRLGLGGAEQPAAAGTAPRTGGDHQDGINHD